MQKKRVTLPGFLILGGFGALLILVLQPTFERLKQTSSFVPCAANLKCIGQALLLYSMDHNGKYPPTLEDLITDPSVDITTEVVICPSTSVKRASAASPEELRKVLVSGGRPDAFVSAPKRPSMHMSYIYLAGSFDKTAPPDAVFAYEPLSNHDGDGTNVLYGDGHVSFLNRQEALRLIAELQSGHNPPRALGQG
jgi:prepilin-type processing-associated H-X9-DG protein